MPTDLILFDGYNVRILNKNGTPWNGYEEAWFVPREIAQAIGAIEPRVYANKILYRNPEKFEGFQGVTRLVTPGGIQETNIINENGLYMFLMASDLPKAIGFQRKVTEILKSIRKTGGYLTQPDYQNESLRAAMEIFRGLDINNMKASDRAAFFKMVSNSFNTNTPVKIHATGTAVPDRGDMAKEAMEWLRKEYAKRGEKLAEENDDWLLVRYDFWKAWAGRNNYNLTLILRELHRQGIVEKFSDGSRQRYTTRKRINGKLVSTVWVKREEVGTMLRVVSKTNNS